MTGVRRRPVGLALALALVALTGACSDGEGGDGGEGAVTTTSAAPADYGELCVLLGEVAGIEGEIPRLLGELDAALRADPDMTDADLAASQLEQVQVIVDQGARQVELLDDALGLPPPPELVSDLELLRGAKAATVGQLEPTLEEVRDAPPDEVSAALAGALGGSVVLENGVAALQAQYALEPFTSEECGFTFQA